MKILFAYAFTFAIVLTSCTDKKRKDAAIYNDGIVKQIEVSDSIFMDILNPFGFDNFEKQKSKTVASLQQTQQMLGTLQPVDGDDSLRQNANKLIENYITLINNDYSKVYVIMNDSDYFAADSTQVDSIMENLFNVVNNQKNILTAMQKRFGERYKITLE